MDSDGARLRTSRIFFTCHSSLVLFHFCRDAATSPSGSMLVVLLLGILFLREPRFSETKRIFCAGS